MASRLNLHEELCALLGTRKVYFQPPESVHIEYPCIIYSVSGADSQYADDKLYNITTQYSVQVVGTNPDSALAYDIAKHFSMCRYLKRFVMNNLYHDNLLLYY